MPCYVLNKENENFNHRDHYCVYCIHEDKDSFDEPCVNCMTASFMKGPGKCSWSPKAGIPLRATIPEGN